MLTVTGVQTCALPISALKTILESKVSTLVEGIARSFEELGEDGRRHPRLAREISALDRLVTATVHAMEF